MSEFTPHFAPVVVLFFLGTALMTGVSLLVLFYGAVRRSSFFARLGAGAVFATVTGYLILLGGVSFASTEKVLPAGGWKYFCEIDCHTAYSLIGAQTAEALGPEMQQTAAHGKFIIVRMKTWFDERTISSHRGNGALTPNPRKVVLVDDTGRRFEPSADGQAAFERLGNPSTSLSAALRPGESYTTNFVFDVPRGARGLRLLITQDDAETRLMIGHENSLLHKKIYFSVDSAPPLAKAAQ
jgi:hypothetical protein